MDFLPPQLETNVRNLTRLRQCIETSRLQPGAPIQFSVPSCFRLARGTCRRVNEVLANHGQYFVCGICSNCNPTAETIHPPQFRRFRPLREQPTELGRTLLAEHVPADVLGSALGILHDARRLIIPSIQYETDVTEPRIVEKQGLAAEACALINCHLRISYYRFKCHCCTKCNPGLEQEIPAKPWSVYREDSQFFRCKRARLL